ncbi:MAG: 3'-5' exonuclease [Thiotrichales bacterium]|nr:3'-5' exonuclease [Thiotrichales bacterium]MCY4284027.1 3'-5' exonuclease [Thiotrichales bacterium]MCY4350999.1 3'-5' exonuclease [Thiotrichales bacterium]
MLIQVRAFLVNVLAFDIETVPDVESGRRLLGLDGLGDAEVARIMRQRQQQASGTEMMRHHLNRIVAIAVVLRTGERFRVWSLGDPDSSERELVERFFDGIERYSPNLVSWNGGGFDLPVLHYRALLHGVAAPRYWESGDDDQSFRWNNYLNRFHSRHTDLMDVLAAYQPRAFAPLDEIAQMLGFPGKLGMDGSRVWEAYAAGEIERIRAYCEVDALNTFFIHLRHELMRGRLSPDGYERECEVVRDWLQADERDHLAEFLRAWGPS